MKTFFKLLVAVVVINACVRGGTAALHYYQLKDTAQQAVLFGADVDTADIQDVILQRARALNLPVDVEDVQVNRQGGHTWAETSYRQPIEFFPNQTYPINWSFSVEGYSLVLGAPAAKRKK
jgi:hypothetical protein